MVMYRPFHITQYVAVGPAIAGGLQMYVGLHLFDEDENGHEQMTRKKTWILLRVR